MNISSSQISLSSTNHLKCFTVMFPTDNDVCDMEPRRFMLLLKRRVDDQLLTVNFRQQNITININDGKVYAAFCSTYLLSILYIHLLLAQDCASVTNAAAIAVPIILILIIIAIIIIVVLLVLYFKRERSHRYFPEHLGKFKSVFLCIYINDFTVTEKKNLGHEMHQKP